MFGFMNRVFYIIFWPAIALYRCFDPPKPTVVSCVEQEYYNAQLDKLKAERELEYWTAMVPMMKEREARLRKLLKSKDLATIATPEVVQIEMSSPLSTQ